MTAATFAWHAHAVGQPIGDPIFVSSGQSAEPLAARLGLTPTVYDPGTRPAPLVHEDFGDIWRIGPDGATVRARIEP